MYSNLFPLVKFNNKKVTFSLTIGLFHVKVYREWISFDQIYPSPLLSGAMGGTL